MNIFEFLFATDAPIGYPITRPPYAPIDPHQFHVTPMTHHRSHDSHAHHDPPIDFYSAHDQDMQHPDGASHDHDHSLHSTPHDNQNRAHIRKYNHTYLDHLDEMPPDLRDYINEHYNGKFVMASIAPETEHDWNVTNTGNSTGDLFSDRKPWQKILDKVVTYIMTFNVVGLMLGMGCAIYWRDVVSNLWPPIGIIIGMCGQFLLLPATGFGFSILFKLKPYEALGCLVVSCSPGGSFSNFFTFWVDGDLALSIVMTACSSIIAFVGMPFNLWLYSSYYVGEKSSEIVIPYLSIVRALSFICGPVIIGMIIRHFSEKVAQIITRVTSIVGYVGFLTVLTSWAILYWKVFTTATPLIYASAIILPVTGFSTAYIVALLLRRPHKVCRTIGIETGSQNMPVALSIILLSFKDPEIRAKMLLFPTLYGIFMLCEVFLGIGLYKSVTYCMKSKKESEYPAAQTARFGNGSLEEKEKFSV